MRAWFKSLIDRLPWIEDMRLQERMRQELDTGQFDEVLDAAAGEAEPAEQQPYSQVKPFDPDAWAVPAKLCADPAKARTRRWPANQ